MAAIAGMRGTGDWGTNERPTNFRDTILWLDPNGDSPFTALISKMRSESVNDPQYQWWEETLGNVQLTLEAQLIGDTTFTVASGALNFVAGDLLLVDNSTGQGEIIQVTTTPTVDTSIIVARGVAGSTATAITAGWTATKIGSAFAEGTSSPSAVSVNPTQLLNYCQIFKTSYDMTESARRTYARTGDLLKNERKRKMFAHARDQELAYLFGRAFLTTGTNGKPLRYCGGLNSFIQTNRMVFSGTTGANGWNTDNFIAFLAQVFNYNGEGAGNERLMLCGNSFLTKLNQMIKDDSNTRITFDGTVKTYGMNLQKFVLPQGVMYLRTHPLFNVHPVYTLSAFVINPRGIVYRYLRDTDFKDNIQLPDADELKGEWLTEAGIEVHHERTMAYLGQAGG